MPRRIKEVSGNYEDEYQDLSLYDEVILEVFNHHFETGSDRLIFKKDELTEICAKHGIIVRNIPDIIYTYRVRRSLPTQILSTGNWGIEPAGRGTYAFRLLRNAPHFEIPFYDYEPIEIYNALPEVVEGLLRRDEQYLLTRLLYNRLVDIFSGLTCFHIQNHYRSFVMDMGEVEVDASLCGGKQKWRFICFTSRGKESCRYRNDRPHSDFTNGKTGSSRFPRFATTYLSCESPSR